MMVPADMTWAQATAAEQSSTTTDGGLSDIVVTAQRRSENLQDVPLTVNSVDAGALAANGVALTTDLTSAVPGLVTQQIAGSFTPFIRGIGTNQTTIGAENSVAVYIDGVYQGSKAGNVFELNDVDHIEVLKGPQGTLFGRNATGGAISVVTRDPSREFEAEASASYGRFDEKTARAYVSGPVSDTLRAGLSYSGHWDDGWIRDPSRGNKRLNPYASQAGTAKLVWDPTKSLNVSLYGAYSHLSDPTSVSQHPLRGTITAAQVGGTSVPQDSDHASLSTGEPVQEVNATRVTGKIQYNAGAFDIVSITGYVKTNLDITVDVDSTPTNVQFLTTTQRSKQFSQEVQLQSHIDGPFSWILGAYYLHYEDYYPGAPNNWAVGIGLPAEVRPADLQQAGKLVLARTVNVTTRSLSAFAEGKLALGEATHITAGLRYTQDRKELDGSFYRYSAVPGGGDQTNLLANGVLGADGLIFATVPTGTLQLSKKWSKPTWRLVVDHEFAPRVMGYASYSRGFKSGTLALSTTAVTLPPVDPEVLDAFEVGLKSELFDRTLRLNLSAFYYKYRNIQVAQVTENAASLIQNAASARIFGLDFDAEFRPTRTFSLNVGANLLNSRYLDFPAAQLTLPNVAGRTCSATVVKIKDARAIAALPQTGGNCQLYRLDASGQDLVNAPRFTANMTGTYRIDFAGGSEMALTAGLYHNSGYDLFPGGVFTHVGAYQSINASIAWRAPDDRYSVRLWGENLSNDRPPVEINTTGPSFWEVNARPVTYGITVGMKFGG
jgi:iron complex outermembrane receptor protein